VKLCIHRGAHEIGGTCIEVEAQGARIVLDIGLPLDVGDDEPVALPAVTGLDGLDASLLGLLISHGHRDHWGLVDQVAPAVPIYVGEATRRMLEQAAFFASGAQLNPAGSLRHREPFELGPFTITPFLNDHSAFDTYSVLVEADGRRVFYSADLQAHGRKARLFETFVDDPPRDIDLLLLEGTNLRLAADTEAAPAPLREADVEHALVHTFRATRGIVLAMYSAQNIDRLVTMFRASVRSGRTLVVDLYGASVAAATGNPRIPQAGFDNLRVYVPQRQRVLVKTSGEFARVNDIRFARIFPEELAARAGELVLTFRASMMREVAAAGCLDDAVAVWSMWRGYLDRPEQRRLLQFFESHGIPLVIHHTSGHAWLADLQRFARALAPRRAVPIHTQAPERFTEFFENVDLRRDGEWFEV
jgi:ribonuclease J